MKRKFRPGVECLEGRQLLALVNYLALTPNPPRLGSSLSAALQTGKPGPFSPASTTWQFDVSYGGFQTPWIAVAGTVMNASMPVGYPGFMTVEATTTYTSDNPTTTPPAATTVTNTVFVAAPNAAAKDGGGGVPTAFGSPIWMTDLITAGGKAIGSNFSCLVQENIPPVYYTGGGPYTGTLITPGSAFFPGNDGGWWPGSAAESTFYFSAYDSSLHDAFQYFTSPATWATIPVGEICHFTQQLRMTWSMPITTGGVHTFSVPLPSLDWVWSKVDPTQWEVN